MVTVAETLEDKFPTNNYKDIPLKGFVVGNHGVFNRHWFKESGGTVKPGMGCILQTGDNGEDTVTLWGAAAWRGYGFAGWDKSQLSAITVAYTAADLIPVYPFIENPGCYFQGYVADTDGAWNQQTYLIAAATGSFINQPLTGESHIYAQSLYYIADTAAAATRVVMREFHRVGRGSTGSIN